LREDVYSFLKPHTFKGKQVWVPSIKNNSPGTILVSGESGPKARIMEEAWVIDIRDQCIASAIPFFFKQWGGVVKKRTGRCLEGNYWDQLPAQSNLYG